MDEFDRRLLNRLQHGLPLEPHPYALLAAELDCREEDILRRLDDLLDDGTLTRFGPLFDIETLGGAFTLAAMSVPEARFEEIAALLAGWPQVAHNYRREHALNMWLVVACDSPAAVASEAEIEGYRQQIRLLLGEDCRADEMLVSSRILKKTGLRLAQKEERPC